MNIPHHERLVTRRDFLLRAGAGFGALALTYLEQQRLFASTGPAALDPLAAKPPNFSAKAKSVIFLFMEGGPSHLDTFDYKPRLRELAGQKLPVSGKSILHTRLGRGTLQSAGEPWRYRWRQRMGIRSIVPRRWSQSRSGQSPSKVGDRIYRHGRPLPILLWISNGWHQKDWKPRKLQPGLLTVSGWQTPINPASEKCPDRNIMSSLNTVSRP